MTPYDTAGGRLRVIASAQDPFAGLANPAHVGRERVDSPLGQPLARSGARIARPRPLFANARYWTFLRPG